MYIYIYIYIYIYTHTHIHTCEAPNSSLAYCSIVDFSERKYNFMDQKLQINYQCDI